MRSTPSFLRKGRSITPKFCVRQKKILSYNCEYVCLKNCPKNRKRKRERVLEFAAPLGRRDRRKKKKKKGNSEIFFPKRKVHCAVGEREGLPVDMFRTCSRLWGLPSSKKRKKTRGLTATERRATKTQSVAARPHSTKIQNEKTRKRNFAPQKYKEEKL